MAPNIAPLHYGGPECQGCEGSGQYWYDVQQGIPFANHPGGVDHGGPPRKRSEGLEDPSTLDEEFHNSDSVNKQYLNYWREAFGITDWNTASESTKAKFWACDDCSDNYERTITLTTTYYDGSTSATPSMRELSSNVDGVEKQEHARAVTCNYPNHFCPRFRPQNCYINCIMEKSGFSANYLWLYGYVHVSEANKGQCENICFGGVSTVFGDDILGCESSLLEMQSSDGTVITHATPIISTNQEAGIEPFHQILFT